MAKKIRKQTLPLGSYLEKIREEDIREDQDVQRLSGQFDNAMINELIVTVLTDDYIPPIILGEEELGDGVVQQYIVDGLQRSSSLSKFKYCNYKITSSIENSIIEYQRKKMDNGKICRNNDGSVIWERAEFDIKNKTYEDLPKELKKNFNDYQIEVVIHQNCTMKMISKLVRRYNNHKAMNASQRAFTYVDEFARKIRTITEHDFFKECENFSEKDKKNGVYERVVCESVMAMFHMDNWQKQGKKMGGYLNEHSCNEEFETLHEVLNRMNSVLAEWYDDIFTGKNAFIWFALFHRFTKYGVDDSKFADFINFFRNELHSKALDKYDGESFDVLDEKRNTKDKKLIIRKLNMLEDLLLDYLSIQKATVGKEIDMLEFVHENLNPNVTEDDIDFYCDVLDGLTLNVNNNSLLMSEQNRPSLVCIVAYSFEKDIDLDDWIVDYFGKNSTYIRNQKENYIHMINDVTRYISSKTNKIAG